MTRWVAPLYARFCIVCLEWTRARDRENFLRYVRRALAEGKTEGEIARALGMDDIADPFAEPARDYLSALLGNMNYTMREKRLLHLIE